MGQTRHSQHISRHWLVLLLSIECWQAGKVDVLYVYHLHVPSGPTIYCTILLSFLLLVDRGDILPGIPVSLVYSHLIQQESYCLGRVELHGFTYLLDPHY